MIDTATHLEIMLNFYAMDSTRKSSCIIQAARWTLLTKRFMKVHFIQNCGNTISSPRDMQGCLLSHVTASGYRCPRAPV